MVTDEGGETGSDTVMVTVDAPPPPPPAPLGPTLLFSENFQGGFGQWTTDGGGWSVRAPSERRLPGSAVGNLVAHADNCDAPCTLTLKEPLNLSALTSATLRFQRYVDRSLDAGEFLRVEAFDGTSWQLLALWTEGQGNDDAWHEEVFDLSNFLTGAFSLRFVTLESSSLEEVELDDLRLEGLAG
jgi:hypothetical protein